MVVARESKEARLDQLRAELLTVEGTPTEVYSRIVGYYRSVRNWNAGKREEFAKRKEFTFPSTACARDARDTVSYMLFTRATCPNCPPVKEYLGSSGLPGVIVDVDTADGLELARRYEVLSTPTAIMLDAEGSQLSRAHSRQQLESLVRPAIKVALESAIA